jgi:hypothetical protein
MPQPASDFPFAYRLPTDVALQIRDGAPPLVTMGSPRRRMIVLVLTFVALAGGLAATLPSGDAQAMVEQECLFHPRVSPTATNDPLLCL